MHSPIGSPRKPTPRGRLCPVLLLLLAGPWSSGIAVANTQQLGTALGIDLLDSRTPTSYNWSTGDLLVSHFSASGSIGGIAGGKDVVVIPEVSVFGNTIVPEVRRDTRSGLRLTTDINGHAGIVLSAGMTLGGGGINSHLHLGPSLTLPDQVRAGRFFGLQGTTGLDTSSSLDLNLPSFNAGLDVVMGGSASGKLEYGLFPFTGYKVGNFNFNLPDINLPVFDLNLDFNLPRLPDFNFLGLPDIIPASDKDNTLFTQKLPVFDATKPITTVLSAGEIDLVNPVSSATTTHKVSTDGAIVNTTSGELFRLGLDLDGLASYAATGVSFTGLELPIKVKDTTIAKLKYDTVDVKYGLELGYQLENRIDAYLEMNIDFVDPVSGDPIDVLMRDSGGTVSMGSTLSGRWDQLPELALLNASDVQMDIDFTGLKRTLGMSGSLTLSDYMELKVLAASAKITGGALGVEIGPLLYKKLQLAGELASFELFNDSITLSDFGLVAGLWDSSVLINAIPTNDAIRQQSRGRGASNDPFDPVNLRLMKDGSEPTTLTDTVVVFGTADGSGLATRHNVLADRVNDPGIATPGDTGPATNRVTQLDGLVLPRGSTYLLATNAVRRLHLRTIENGGLISGEHGFLSLRSSDPAGVLSLTGDGGVLFGRSGEIRAGTLLHGKGHNIYFSQTHSAYDSWGRHLFAAQQIANSGRIWVLAGELTPETPKFINHAGGLLQALGDGRINLRSELYNEGLIRASGSAGGTDALIDIQADTVHGGLDGQVGSFLADQGGDLRLRRDPSSFYDELRLSRKLNFTSRDGGSSITFEGPINIGGGDVELVTESGGTMVLNGLIRENESDRINIINRGLLEIASGKTSLRVSGTACPGCGGGTSSVIRPIDLLNEGTVRIHGGAEFAFDVDIVDYAEGGATLAGGTWELLGQTSWPPSSFPTKVAVLDVRVSDVFGNADRFTGLSFDETVDPDTGQVSVSGISGLNTALVYNNASVTFSGASSFAYFNTLQVNRGTLKLLNRAGFNSVGNLENRGGELLVDSGAGLYVNGALLVNGGTVTIGDGSFLGVAGGDVRQPDDTLAHRDIEVNGGTLRFTANSLVNEDGLVESPSAGYGNRLVAGRSWIVRDRVVTDASGNEVVTPGTIDFAMRSGPADTAGVRSGVDFIAENDAEVRVEGPQARFKGLEKLKFNDGKLTFAGGNTYTHVAHNSGNTLVNRGGTITLEGSRFIMSGAGNTFENRGGKLIIDQDSHFSAGTVRRAGGLSTIDLDGVLQVSGFLDAGVLRIHGGTVLTDASRRFTSAQVSIDQEGGTIVAGGVCCNLLLNEGLFDFVSSNDVFTVGNFFQYDGTLQLDWDGGGIEEIAATGIELRGGRLQIRLLDGFLPRVGDSIEILTASNSLQMWVAPLIETGYAGLELSLRQAGTSLFLDVAAVPLPAAFWLLATALAGILLLGRRGDSSV